LAYLTAYLKAHYPVEFMSALLTSEAGTDKVVKYIVECKELGIEVKPPDVNKSDFSFTPDGDSIRFGLGAVKMTGEGTVAAIIEGRAKNPYKHIYDFCSRSNVNKRVVESLVRAGAFDSTGANRAQLFEAVENAVKAGSKEAKNRKIGQNSFFMDDEEDEEVYSDIPDWSIEEKLKGEREAIGIFVSGHPLDKHKGIVSLGSTHRTDEMKSLPKESIVTLCCLITGIEIKTSPKNGSKWAAMRLDDGRGSVEAMCFAKTYANVYGQITEDNAVAVRAVVISEEGETTKLSIQEVVPLAAMSLGRPKALRAAVEAEEGKALELRQIVTANRGTMPLYFDLRAGGFGVEMEIQEGVEFTGSLVEAVAGVGSGVRVLVG
jgi:DNA polymerase-3 subunit alpha